MVTTDELNDIKSFVDELISNGKTKNPLQIERTLREGWNLAIRPGEKETTYFYLSDKGELRYASLGIGSTIESIEEKLKQANEYSGLPHQLNNAYTIRNGILYLKEPYTDIGPLID